VALVHGHLAPVVVQPLLGVEDLLEDVLGVLVGGVLVAEVVQVLVELLQLVDEVVVELLVTANI